MSAEDFQLVAVSNNDDSITKRGFIKTCHQHGAEVNIGNQNIKFYFGENRNYIQIGNGCLEADKEVKIADDTSFTNADETRLVNKGLAHTFRGGRLCTSSGTEIENNIYLAPFSAIMRILTHKDGDLSSFFDKTDEIEAGNTNSTLKHMLIDSHTIEDSKGKIRASFPPNIFLTSAEHLKKWKKVCVSNFN